MISSKYEPLVKQLAANGVDFSRDVRVLDDSELQGYHNLSKKYGYKKPLLHSRGYGFYQLLQKVYKKLSH